MIFLKKIQCLILIGSLLNISTVYADNLKFDEGELNVLKKLNIDSSQRSTDSKSSLDQFKEELKSKLNEEKDRISKEGQEKLQNLVDQKIKPKIENLKNQIDVEKDSLKKDISKIVTGYMVSTVSLLAATLIAPQALMLCGAKPSVVIYAGSASIYIINEIQNIQLLKASLLGELEVVNGLEIDKNKSLKENTKLIEEKVDQQIGYIKAYKNTLDHAVVALKKKGKNAKMVSAGFLASSAVAAAEQMDYISGGGACLASVQSQLNNFVNTNKIDSHYEKLITQTTKMEDKWSYYFEWESQRLATTRSFNHKEYEKFKNIKIDDSIFIQAMKVFSQTLLNNAQATENTSKKEISADLKKSKTADWISDLDKMGIVGGVALNIVAYMTGWQMGFLKSILANGTSRSITFGVQAALAFSAGSLFEQGANELEIKLKKVDKIIDDIQALAKNGVNALVPSDIDAQNLKDFAQKLGVPSNKIITEMSLSEAESFLKEIKKKSSELGEEGKALLKRFEDDLQNKIKKIEIEKNEKLKKLLPKSSWIKFLNEMFINSAQAQDVRNLKSKKNVIPQNGKNKVPEYLLQTMELHKKFHFFNQTKNDIGVAKSSKIILENRAQLELYRNNLFNKLVGFGTRTKKQYSEYENAKIKDEINKFEIFFQSFTQDQKKIFEESMNPLNFQASNMKNLSSNNGGLEKKATLSWQEVNVLEKLLSRLDAQAAAHSNPLDSIDRNFKIINSSDQRPSSLDFGEINIHSKDVDLFEVIHHRYQQTWKRMIED